jgi:chromosome segregation ATPase
MRISNSSEIDDEEKRRRHREAQKRYMDKQRMGWNAYFEGSETLTNQISQLNYQLTEKQTALTILQSQLNERNTNISLLQQLVNVKESSRLQLQNQLNNCNSQINRSSDSEPNLVQLRSPELSLGRERSPELIQKDHIISQLQIQNSQFETSISQLQLQNSEKDLTISQLQLQNSEKDLTISQLQSQTSQNDSTIFQLQSQNSQLHSQLSGCVTTDVDRRLQELSQTLNNKIQQEQLCLQTISQLTSDNSGLKIFSDILSDINSKYPKFLPSFVTEIQQPGNHSSYPEIDTWSREQLNRIVPNEILPLDSFRASSPVQVNPSPIINQPLISNPNLNLNPNIPNDVFGHDRTLSLQNPLLITSNINHPASNDPDFQRWRYLYNNNIKKTTEYNNLYQNLRNRYNTTPIQIVKQYSTS